METLAVIAALLAGYLLGSVSFAVIVSRLFGLADPRSYGSGNPGATNVLRSGSKAAALVTLLGDALKGVLAVYLVRWFGPSFGLGDATAPGPVRRPSSATCTRCSSTSRAARAWRRFSA